MHLLYISVGFCLAFSTLAGVVPQSLSESPDVVTQSSIDQDQVAGIVSEDGVQNVEADISYTHHTTGQNDDTKTRTIGHPDIGNQLIEHSQRLKNASSQAHHVKNAKNSKSDELDHSKHRDHHHALPHKSEDYRKKNMHRVDAPGQKNSEIHKSGIAALRVNDEEPANKHPDNLSKRSPAMQPSSAVPKKSFSTATHKTSSIASSSTLHIGNVAQKSSTAHDIHSQSSSHPGSTRHPVVGKTQSSTTHNTHKPSSIHSRSIGHSSAGKAQSSKVAVAHKASTSNIASTNKGKGKNTSQNKVINNHDPLKVDPGSLGPQSNTFLKGPYGPIFDFYNLSPNNHVGDQIDPVQKQLWDQQGITHNRGVPPGSKFHILNARDVQSCPFDDDDPSGECKTSIDPMDEPRSSDSKYNGQNTTERSVLSRLNAFVKRVTIGAMSSVVGIVNQPSDGYQQKYIVFNGQPGMIWLKQKGDITGCPPDSHNNIIDNYKVYVPSIFYTDTAGRKRCNQPCVLFWVTGNGPVVSNRLQVGAPNFINVVIAGQCNDCYPWEVQAEGVVISAIASNLTIDWNKGLWGPTLALGDNANFYTGNSNDL